MFRVNGRQLIKREERKMKRGNYRCYFIYQKGPNNEMGCEWIRNKR